jgi:hypothetical protein
LPPDGFVRVAPQTVQEIAVVAREKMILSAEQSRHETFRKLAVIIFTSIVYQFELLSSLAWSIVSFSSLSTTE